MENFDEMTKTELNDELRKMEIEKEDLEKKLDEFEVYQQEMGEKNQRYYWQFEEMRERLNQKDPKIMSLIDEGQQQLNSLKQRGREVYESIEKFENKKHLEWDMKEDIYMEINRL